MGRVEQSIAMMGHILALKRQQNLIMPADAAWVVPEEASCMFKPYLHSCPSPSTRTRSRNTPPSSLPIPRFQHIATTQLVQASCLRSDSFFVNRQPFTHCHLLLSRTWFWPTPTGDSACT